MKLMLLVQVPVAIILLVVGWQLHKHEEERMLKQARLIKARRYRKD